MYTYLIHLLEEKIKHRRYHVYVYRSYLIIPSDKKHQKGPF